MKYSASSLRNKYILNNKYNAESAKKKLRELDTKFSKNPKKYNLLTDMAELAIVCGDFGGAKALLEKAINENKSGPHPKNYRLLGDIYNLFEQPKRAVPYFYEAMKLHEEYEEAMSGLGNSLLKLKDYEQAAHFLQKALELNNSPANNHSIGVLLYHSGHIQQASAYLMRAYSLDQESVGYMVSYAKCLFRLDRTKEAASIFCRAYNMEPENEYLPNQIVSVLKETRINAFDQEIADTVVRLFDYDGVEHTNLTAAWARLLISNPRYHRMRSDLNVSSYEDFKQLACLDDYQDELNDDFICKGLTRVVNVLWWMEEFLTYWRRYSLESVVSEGGKSSLEGTRKLLYATSTNCFFNEYIFSVSDEEKRNLDLLKNRILDHVDTDQLRDMVALLGSYEPIYKQDKKFIELANGLKDGASEEYLSLMKFQLDEPLEEGRIKQDIPIIGNITDIVSQKVREQYEENPYPRWRSASLERDKQAGIMFQKPYEILIAGCGTGKQIMQDRQKYPNAHITAVDLSRASIAYAQRKINEMGVKNVDIAQADILELGNVFGDKKFDFVMCSGVLHHMHDPEAGLAVLKSLLKPEGQMNIGLYSEYAREQVVANRELVKEKGWPSTVEGIRALREYVMGLDNSDPMKAVASWRDFFTTSMCRDLLFHVQEHRYTFPKLKDMLDRFDLAFLAHSYLPVSVLQKFQKKFPNKDDYYDLMKWEEFEAENKEAFAAMYQMWICHKDAKEKIQMAPAVTAQVLP